MTKQELAAKIWATANELRKNIKASEYKDYILGFMFYKYLSDKELDFVKSEGGSADDLKDNSEDNKKYFQDKLGYFIPYDNLFSTWKAASGKLGAQDVAAAIETFYQNLNEKYARCFYVYNKEVNKHSGVFDALDAGLSKLGENVGSRDKAVRDIVELVAQIPPKSKEFDVLGYIYEYLIQQFSSEAKKDGAFYTPHELTSLMSRIVAERLKDRKEIRVYDPCVGSAGLLLNMGRECSKYIDPSNISYFGQELITETSNLAKMNLFMQDVPVHNIVVRNANTLEEDWPYFDEDTAYSPLFVDAVTANPPYSARWDPDSYISDERFRQYGLAPGGKADYAFLLHCLYHIRPDGVMAIVLPHGVLFRGDAEESIRKNLIDNHNIETIIGMPSNLFYSTGIPVIIMILSKNRAESDVLFIDASKCYKKDKKQNVLCESDVQKIYDAVINRKDIPHFAKLVTKEQIKKEKYNLNIPRYVCSDEEAEIYDLYSVMSGSVSDEEIDLHKDFWKQFPALKARLFKKDELYSTFLDVDINHEVFGDKDVSEFLCAFKSLSQKLREFMKNALINSETDSTTRDTIVDELFSLFGSVDLVDKYSVYQEFASRWLDIEADLGRIRAEGKQVCRQLEEDIVVKKNTTTKKFEDIVVGMKGKVIPLDLIKAEYYTDDFKTINELQGKQNEAIAEYTSIFDSLDDDVRASIVKEDDDTKFDAKKIKAEAKGDNFEEDVIGVLTSMLSAIEADKEYKKKIKTMKANLDEKAQEKLQNLTDSEIDELLIKKWIDPIISGIDGAANSVINSFVAKLEKLQKKYSNPLSELAEKKNDNSQKLKSMLGNLSGNDVDMKAIKMLIEEL